jgi:hypothetical protein
VKTIQITQKRTITTPFLTSEEAAEFCQWCKSKFLRMAREYCLPYAGERQYPRYLAPVLVQWLVDLREAPAKGDPGFSEWLADRERALSEMQNQWAQSGYHNGTL